MRVFSIAVAAAIIIAAGAHFALNAVQNPRLTPMPPAPRVWIGRSASTISAAKDNQLQAVRPSPIARKLHVRIPGNPVRVSSVVTAMVWPGPSPNGHGCCDALVERMVENRALPASRAVSLAARPGRSAQVTANDGGLSGAFGGDGRDRAGLTAASTLFGAAHRRLRACAARRHPCARRCCRTSAAGFSCSVVSSALDSPANTTFSSATMRGMICSTTSLPLLVIRIDTSRLLVSERVRVTHPRRAAWEISRDIVGGSRLVAPARSTCRNSPLIGEHGKHAPERNGQVMALQAGRREADQRRADAVDQIGQPFRQIVSVGHLKSLRKIRRAARIPLHQIAQQMHLQQLYLQVL